MLGFSIGTLQVSHIRVATSADKLTAVVSGVFFHLCSSRCIPADKICRMDKLPVGRLPGFQAYGPVSWVYQRLL